MERRKILTAAGALAGVSLTGCGGGDSTSETASAPSSAKAGALGQTELAAAANPATLVPIGTKMARLEVAFTTRRKVTVTLYNTVTGIGIKAGEKVATSSATHALQFGTVYFTNASWAAGNLYLEVTSDTGEIGKEYIAYTDPWAEHEWSYFYRVNATVAWERIATVRFFPTQAEIENFNFTQHLKTYPNTAVVQNRGNLELKRAQVTPVALDFPDRSARVISTQGNADTLCLPDLRRAGPDSPFELLPLLPAASGRLRECIEERLTRQNISRSISLGGVRRRRLNDGTTNEFDYDRNYVIEAYQELLIYVGGTQLGEFIRESRKKYQDEFARLAQSFTRPVYNFIDNFASNLISDADSRKISRTLKDIAEALPVTAAGGLTGSLNIQFAGGFQNFQWPQQLTGFGGRISLAVARFSVGSSASGHKVTKGWPVPDSPYKAGIVGILKGRTAFGFVDYDIEVTCNLNFQYGKCQVANLQFDPVFDIDTRGVIYTLLKNVYKYTMDSTVPDVAPLDDIELPEIYLQDDVEAVSSAAERSNNRDDLGILENVVITSNSTQKNIPRTFKTLELSPLRLVFHNNRAAEEVFSTEWPIWSVAYMPGAKYILGGGFQTTTEFKSDEVVDFRRFWYARMVLIADVHTVVASDPIARALSAYPDNS